MPCHHIDRISAYSMHRSQGNPPARITFMESMY